MKVRRNELLKDRNFLLLMFGKLVSMLGSNMLQFALSVYVLKITGSATIFASMLSILIIPRLLLSPIAGVFGDWFDRKNMIVFMDILNSIIIGGFYYLDYRYNGLTVSMIYILVILLEITEIFFGAAMSAVIPSIVEEGRLRDANAINSIVNSVGGIAAPIIGSTIYSIFGLSIVLLLNSVSFLLSGISEMFIDIPKTINKDKKLDIDLFKSELKEGINITRENKFLSTIMIMGLFLNFVLGGISSVGLTFIIKEVLLISDIKMGIGQGVISLFMMFSPLIVLKISKDKGDGELMFKSLFGLSLSIFVLVITVSNTFIGLFDSNLIPYILLIIFIAIMSSIAAASNMALSTIFQKIVPISAMGRVSSIMNLCMTLAMPMGQMFFGILFDRFNQIIPFTIGSIIILVVVLYYKDRLLEYDMELESKK